jgi:hypothetical protein
MKFDMKKGKLPRKEEKLLMETNKSFFFVTAEREK